MNIVNTIKANSRTLKNFVTMNSHTIKSVLAMAGVVGVGYTSHQAAGNAVKLKEKATEEKGSELSKVEEIVAVVPAYALPVAVGIATEGLIFSANKDATGKIMAATALASMYKDQINEFVEKAETVVGTGKVNEIKSEIKREHTLQNLPENINEPLLPLKQWFYDEHTGQYFVQRMDQFLHVIQVATCDLAVDQYIPYENLAIGWGEHYCESIAAAYMEKGMADKIDIQKDWLELEHVITETGVDICNFSFGDHVRFR